MANQEFYSPIKQDTDVIKQSTTSIETATQRIETSVNEIQNTDLSNVNYKLDNLVTGTRFENKSPVLAGNIGNYAHQTYTHLDILGSGFIVSTYDPSNYTFIIEVDGNIDNKINTKNFNFFPYRFNNSVKISCARDVNTAMSMVILD